MTTPNTSAVNELFPIEIFKKQLMANHANCKLSTVNSPLSNCSRLNIFKNISPCITNRCVVLKYVDRKSSKIKQRSG
jgi:hypothetical protein